MSPQSPFDTTQRIFRNRDILTVDSYQPDELIEREEQIEAYASALEPVLNGWQPNNIFVYGKTGTGKTATTAYMLDWLDHDIAEHNDTTDTEAIHLDIISLNCEALTSSYQVAIELLNTLRDETQQVATRGHAPSDIYTWLFDAIDARNGVILIVLDEIDHIGADDTILYQLARAESTNNLDHSSLGVIGISNDFSFRDALSAKVKDSLCEKEILFPAYTATELAAILTQRAQMALYDAAYTRGVITKAAAYAARDKGSARQAIDILRNAGDLARQKHTDTITEALVTDAKGIVERGRVSDLIGGLSPHGKYVLYALTVATQNEQTPVRTNDLYELYKRVCHQESSEALSIRAVRDHLSELDLIGIAAEHQRNVGRAGGKYKQYELAVTVDAILNAFQTDEAVQTTSEIGY
jgi:cell division control protein 6